MRLLNTRVPTQERFSDSLMKKLLQNAVEAHPALNQIKTTGDVLSATFGGRPIDLSYSAYLALLKASATGIDESNRRKQRPSRQVNSHETFYEEMERFLQDAPDPPDLPGSMQDWDDAIPEDWRNDAISAYVAARSGGGRPPFRPYRASLPRAVWDSIPTSEQEIWDQMSQETKAAILNYAKNDRFDPSTGTPARPAACTHDRCRRLP